MFNQISSRGAKFNLKPSQPTTLGTAIHGEGVQFSLFSRNATGVSLLLFDSAEDNQPSRCLPLDPKINRTGDYWHIFIKEIGEGQLYLYRVDGPSDVAQGQQYNEDNLLIDPYCKALTGKPPWARQQDRNRTRIDEVMPKCVVIDDEFDWQGDSPLNYPLRETIIYETHVRGLSRHPSAKKRFGIRHPGTYEAVTEMIPYFKELGITSLEFLPIFEFDTYEYEKTNYWGYSTLAFFAPKGGYAVSDRGTDQVKEFKTMVRELHKAGIEVILDVVFNHTGEGNQDGPVFSFSGLDNTVYYILESDKRFYANYSGCGNTMNCNHPVVMNFIIDCLHYWVQEMHVDGFRFDLASVMTRDGAGHILDKAPIIEAISEDAILGDTKLIAEPWDAGGAYHTGSFHYGRWAEWNDRFRDDVRAFWLGNQGMLPAFATRVSGSSDLYLRSGRKPYHSVNYITAHDGFTLADLVSYNEKHNEDNGENNEDGSNNNLSANWGVEGESENKSILRIRSRMIKNYWTTLLLSIGTPMILGGDEFRRSQRGNNNAYCQDNELSWYDFDNLERYEEIHRFARLIIAFRKKHSTLHRRKFFEGKDRNAEGVPDIEWFDERGGVPDWNRAENILALRIDGSREEIGRSANIVICFNSTDRAVHFTLPSPLVGFSWYRIVDTSLESPNDIVENELEVPIIAERGYTVGERSTAVIIATR